jgi:hypothetical protein
VYVHVHTWNVGCASKHGRIPCLLDLLRLSLSLPLSLSLSAESVTYSHVPSSKLIKLRGEKHGATDRALLIPFVRGI